MAKTERTLRITYSLNAWESFDSAIDALKSYFVRVMPKGGGVPFDAYIVGSLPESDNIGEIEVIRGTSAGHGEGPVETIRVEKIHVY